jgi:predicted thioesterase
VIGLRQDIVIEVTPDMCPAFDDEIVHRVYSTWSLAHHMELAARKVLAPFLEVHEEGMGSHLSIDHRAPTPVGKQVRVEAEATDVTHDRLVCAVRAYDGHRLVAEGTQIQRIFPKKKIERLIDRHR